jgi:hypothetical protein
MKTENLNSRITINPCNQWTDDANLIHKQFNASINFNHYYPLYLVSNNMSESVYAIVDEIFDMAQFYCLRYEY